MVNIDDFIKRLQIILDYYGLSASAFADRIDVQRSSISHLLSGRNKPSLDFILKVIEIFPEVDLYWILNGKGNFPKSEKKYEEKTDTPTLSNSFLEVKKESIAESNLFTQMDYPENNAVIENNFEKKSTIENLNTLDEDVDYIVIFYKNGTFKKYHKK
ncbi:helix-turn-helix domain-containing protein [Flavobacterium sp. NRK F7]|uniref:helix-turn-helix domain-containing protein n=1 Tax=Flavobacterium sp. NRK F7 TaxID=2954930 RepID=UPI00209059FA|nr:helix-turn-helix transcriptional regulator [Flavobacterium sp. NRK F7]MCO6163471.1 helix-turn-helix domain-containing protein [Flavobacterium sp. NRK F7]